MNTYITRATKRFLSVHAPMSVTVEELATCLGGIDDKKYRFLKVDTGSTGLVFEFVYKSDDE